METFNKKKIYITKIRVQTKRKNKVLLINNKSRPTKKVNKII